MKWAFDLFTKMFKNLNHYEIITRKKQWVKQLRWIDFQDPSLPLMNGSPEWYLILIIFMIKIVLISIRDELRKENGKSCLKRKAFVGRDRHFRERSIKIHNSFGNKTQILDSRVSWELKRKTISLSFRCFRSLDSLL